MTMSFLSTITGSFATPCAENPTVAMVEAAYAHHGIDARYLNCDVQPEALGDAVRGARAMGWVGFNCSLPHKVAVIEHLDGLGESAAIIGAVNCAVRQPDGRFLGENTDGKGFLASLLTVADPKGAHVVVLGAGGAARAVAVEVALAGAERVTVVNRGRERGAGLAALVAERTPARSQAVVWDGTYRVPDDAAIVVNATSIGLFPDESRPDVDLASLRPGLVVADVIPNPPRTAFVREAEQRGCTVLDGMGMLVNQGVISIKHWTGVDVDPAVMRARLAEIFGV